MKLIMGLVAFMAAGIIASRMAVKYLGVSEADARLIIYLVSAVFLLGMIIQLFRWIGARRRAAAKGAKPEDPAVAALRVRIVEQRAALDKLVRHQAATAPRRPAVIAASFRGPWLALLGMPGHGKTALLGPTGSKRLVEIDREGPRKGPPEAVPEDRLRLFSTPGGSAYLEVPHALARSEELRPTWLATLKLLRRRGQPLHGVVLAVSAEDLSTDADPGKRAAQLGDDLAAQLADLIAGLEVHVPVYLVITKLDRIAGFTELPGKVESRGQALGFELPDGRSDDLVLKELRGRFDALCDLLDQRSLRAVGRFREPELTTQARLLAFVRQLSELAEPLAALVKPLLTARGGDPVRLRGVYFTSAAQGGEPAVAPVLENLLRGAGGGSYLADDARPPASTRYFLDELVGGVWLRDSALATRTTRARRRGGIWRGTLAGVSVLLAGWVGLDATRTSQSNRQLAQDTADLSVGLKGQLGGERRAPLAVTELERLRTQLALWEDEDGTDAAEVRSWSLFPGESVIGPLQRFYKRAIFEGVIAPLRVKAEAKLHDFQARYESPDAIPEGREWTDGRDELRFYLLLTGPKLAGEHQPISQEGDRLTRELQLRWSSNSRNAVSAADYAAMGRVASKFVKLATDPEFALARDAALIEQVRGILMRDTSEDAAVEDIIDRVSAREDLPKISLRALAGVPSLENDNTDVRGAFTVAGWAHVKTEFQRTEDGAEWVLGLDQRQATELRRKRGKNLRTLYFSRYTNEWSRFIQRMRIITPLNLEQGKTIFGEIVRGPKLPLAKVFLKLQENVTLKDDFDYGDGGIFSLGPKKAGSATAVRAEDVAAQFSRLITFMVPPAGKDVEVALDGYHTHLQQLRDAIGKALDSKEEEKALIEKLKAAIEDTKSVISDGNLEAWNKDTDELLLTPLKELLKLLERDNAQGTKNDWCARIVDPMYERFSGRYPFAADARDDVVLADFEEFFHPEKGVIRKAREDLLSGYVTMQGNYLEARDLGKTSVARLDPEVVQFLNRAQDIGMVMFVNEELRVDFDVILVCNPQVSRVEFKVAGENRVFECNGKQLPRMRWPNKEQGASLTAFGRQGRKTVEENSEWGLFELLEKSSKVPDFTGEEVIEFKFDLAAFNLGMLEVRLKPTRVRGGTAFFGLPNGDRSYLSLLRSANVLPPKRLFVGGGC